MVALLVWGATVLWPRVGHVSGSSTVTVASKDFAVTLTSVRFIEKDEATERSVHQRWKARAHKEANGLLARLGGLWADVRAAHPRLGFLPYDASAPPEPCHGKTGPCRLAFPTPSTMGQVEVVVSTAPKAAARAALAATIKQALERDVPVAPSTIVRDIVGLGRSFPHLRALTASDFDGATLRFQRGRKEAKNEAYAQELAAYEAEVERRRAEDADGSRRKRPPLKLPSRRRTVWEPNGVSLAVRFEAIRPGAELQVRAAAGFVMPGYEAIILQSFPGTEEADLRTWRVITSIVGDDVAGLRTAIRDVLLMHGVMARSSGEDRPAR